MSGSAGHSDQSFPGLFATLAVPKAEELVATPYRHGNKKLAEAFFLEWNDSKACGLDSGFRPIRRSP